MLFDEWLRWFSARMTGRKVLLLMDNCPAHTAGILDIANVEVRFLPPNTMSKLQPLDGGIIRALKAHYRRRQALRTLEQFNRTMQLEQDKVDVLDAINMVVPSWDTDVTASTIANCWRHCGLTGLACEQPAREVDEAVSELQDVLTRIGYTDAIPAQELVEYNGEQEVCRVQTEEEFFASLGGEIPTAEEEEDYDKEGEDDDTIERPHYTSKQVIEALEILRIYAVQKGDDNGEARRAIDSYHRYFSTKFMQTSHQARLPDMFARQKALVELDD